MIVKRRQGRPKRGQDEVGSDYILRQGREALRARRFDIQSRGEIAKAVGISQALINYYFPRGTNVADLILTPVISEHLSHLNDVIASKSSPAVKLGVVIQRLTEAFRRDKHLFDAYEFMIRSCGAGPETDLIFRMQSALADLMCECHRAGLRSPYALSVQHGAIWGMCRVAADIERRGDSQGMRRSTVPHLTARLVSLVGHTPMG